MDKVVVDDVRYKTSLPVCISLLLNSYARSRTVKKWAIIVECGFNFKLVLWLTLSLCYTFHLRYTPLNHFFYMSLSAHSVRGFLIPYWHPLSFRSYHCHFQCELKRWSLVLHSSFDKTFHNRRLGCLSLF